MLSERDGWTNKSRDGTVYLSYRWPAATKGLRCLPPIHQCHIINGQRVSLNLVCFDVMVVFLEIDLLILQFG